MTHLNGRFWEFMKKVIDTLTGGPDLDEFELQWFQTKLIWWFYHFEGTVPFRDDLPEDWREALDGGCTIEELHILIHG